MLIPQGCWNVNVIENVKQNFAKKEYFFSLSLHVPDRIWDSPLPMNDEQTQDYPPGASTGLSV